MLSSTGDQGKVKVLKSKKAALANLVGITAQGALVPSRFMDAAIMDALSKFFFGLENKNGQRKTIHCLFNTEWMEVPEKESDLRNNQLMLHCRQTSPWSSITWPS